MSNILPGLCLQSTVIKCHLQVWNIWILILFVVQLNCRKRVDFFVLILIISHAFILPPPSLQSADFYFIFNDLHLQIIESIFWHRKISSKHLLQSENDENWCTWYAVGILYQLISFLHTTFMKIRENVSAHSRMLQAGSEFDLIFLWRATPTNYLKHLLQSICRELISPVGLKCRKLYHFLGASSAYTLILSPKLPLARIHTATRNFFK